MNIIQKIKELNLPNDQYVIVGSGTMAVLGIREANDIDIAVTKELHQKLREIGSWEECERYNRIFLKKDVYEIIPQLDWEKYETTVEKAIESAQIIEDIPFMKLEELIKFKTALGREKDFKDIELIKKYMSTEKPFVCLITGPAGAGKSSVSKTLAKKFDRSAVVEVDKLRETVVGGYVRPWPHTEESDLQLSLAAKNTCDMTLNFLDKGFNVFIDDVVGKKLLTQYSEYFKDKNFKVFLLLPSVESLLKRFDDRRDDNELRERTIELHKNFMDKKDKLNWQIIDSSNQKLEETADQIYIEIIH